MKFSNLEAIKSIAVVGATGLVGEEFLNLLAEEKISIADVRLLGSEKSEGAPLEVGGRSHYVRKLTAQSFEGVDVAFFSVPDEVTREYVPRAVTAGALVIDDSACYRMHQEVPLIVPEVNGSLLREFTGAIIATPNCSTTPLVMALKPLLEEYGLERVVVSTYQSVSGAGRAAYEELSAQTISLMNGMEVTEEMKVFPHRIAFNCLPEIGSVQDSGNTSEEEKIIRETRKILEMPELKISATAVRVPTFCGHGLSVNVQLTDDFKDEAEIRELFDKTPGIKVLDNPKMHIYPTNVEAVGSDPTFLGRLRRDASVPSGLNFWLIADNLRKGAALNSLQILETLYNYRRMA